MTGFRSLKTVPLPRTPIPSLFYVIYVAVAVFRWFVLCSVFCHLVRLRWCFFLQGLEESFLALLKMFYLQAVFQSQITFHYKHRRPLKLIIQCGAWLQPWRTDYSGNSFLAQPQSLRPTLNSLAGCWQILNHGRWHCFLMRILFTFTF